MTQAPAQQPKNGYPAVGKILLAGAGAGGGLALALGVAEVLRTHEVFQLISGWGPLAGLALLGMVLVDRRLAESAQVQRDGAVAMQSLADSVREIARKDDIAEAQRDLTLNHVAYTVRRIADRLGLEEQAKASGGGA